MPKRLTATQRAALHRLSDARNPWRIERKVTARALIAEGLAEPVTLAIAPRVGVAISLTEGGRAWCRARDTLTPLKRMTKADR